MDTYTQTQTQMDLGDYRNSEIKNKRPVFSQLPERWSREFGFQLWNEKPAPRALVEFKVLFVYMKVHPGHNLKRQKGFSERMNIKAGRELQQEISSVKTPRCYLSHWENTLCDSWVLFQVLMCHRLVLSKGLMLLIQFVLCVSTALLAAMANTGRFV